MEQSGRKYGLFKIEIKSKLLNFENEVTFFKNL